MSRLNLVPPAAPAKHKYDFKTRLGLFLEGANEFGDRFVKQAPGIAIWSVLAAALAPVSQPIIVAVYGLLGGAWLSSLAAGLTSAAVSHRSLPEAVAQTTPEYNNGRRAVVAVQFVAAALAATLTPKQDVKIEFIRTPSVSFSSHSNPVATKPPLVARMKPASLS
jgi:hypothetical protein